ncbi:ABC transporter permease [Deinococcus cellulosilyticus]|uniref:ABC transporter permease n=1 Tax=Deinococcus cellulosilyticus (strain DSM 18568 / NBRC 106333 / KACC 11606 / 5516J-15) TaxID=1223518 RepID=A0A511N3J4_DEIC1|nr:ABC transporter permease [Deinococcus cellulosilyticus]GEM47434.1 ABC transporter permease [Deinococcus cellulosilyticus NBRC 106333 = KACC 11606]
MPISDLFQLALRGLTRRAVRTTLTVLGIVVAVASMVIFLSLGEGIRRVFTQELGNIGPDVQISLNGIEEGLPRTPDLPQSLVQKVQDRKDEWGIRSIIPVVISARGGFDPRQSFLIYGYPTAENVLDISPGVKVKEGRLLGAEDEGKLVAVLGSKAAENAGLKLGQDVRFNRRSFFKVVGILQEEGGFTDSFIFVPKSTLQKAMGVEDQISFIAIKLNDPSKARSTAKTISETLDVEAQTQSDFLKVLDRAVSISDAVRFGISLIALIVGGLAVANTVMMGVFERTREFGTMRAIGAKPGFIRNLVLLESLLLAFMGGIGGILLGFVGIQVVNLYTQNLANISAAALTPRLTLLAFAVSFALGLLSGLLPARSAGRIVITEALGRN